MSGPAIFGRHDGTDVPEVVLRDGNGLEARVIAFGAVLRDLVVPGPAGPQRVVVGLRSLEDYVARSRSFGAIVGRHANRIAGARFRLDGQEHGLVPNEGGNQLHGGPKGFGVRVWTLEAHDGTSCRFRLRSPDGDMGYPGTVEATASYALAGPGTLRVTLEAEADRPTPLNLTGHTYFNLDGGPDIRAHHRLSVAASFYLPVDAGKIPTGEIRSVAGTRLDFRAPRPVRDPDGPATVDHTLVLDRDGERGDGLRHAATLRSERSGISLALRTTEPGLQVYDGSMVDLDITGLGDLPLRPFCGLALEPQRFPDGPNRAHFPPCILRPGGVSRQVTELRFATDR